jgi:hypothetical protein
LGFSAWVSNMLVCRDMVMFGRLHPGESNPLFGGS